MDQVSIVWLRRDLRLQDQAALHYALRGDIKVLPIFIFDPNIIEELPKNDLRISYIYQALHQIHLQLREVGSGLLIFYKKPIEAFAEIISQYNVQAVYTNHDVEPYAINRDHMIQSFLQSHQIAWHTFKDHVFFEKAEVVKENGLPYTVFTPYSKKWKLLYAQGQTPHYACQHLMHNFYTHNSTFPSLDTLGFITQQSSFFTIQTTDEIIKNYHQTRDLPSLQGTSRLSLQLRFGTISIRQLVQKAVVLNEKFLNELIWRDFYQSILWHFPQVVTQSFKPAYDRIQWRNDKVEFDAWCKGETGYPLVDAGMRELNTTGWMHNRVRMVTASFLTKHLLVDWRWGEAYFAAKLLDFDLASNNGGWQWAAGSGVDAAPYFRVFNPTLQAQKFDPDNVYISKWVPEWNTPAYVKPIVVHEVARARCLETYKVALDKQM